MAIRFITANIAGLVRKAKMEDRDYVVVPMVMMVEGVHEGSDGPVYYPAEELGHIPTTWNHKPIVVNHPKRNGSFISACEPSVCDTQKIGVIMNTKFTPATKKTPARLTAEAWVEEARIEKVDKRIADAIAAGNMLEVSIGVYSDLDEEPGIWNGESYNGIARNLKSDHLAILPDEVGACSIADGAGFLRVNERNANSTIREKLRAATLAILSEAGITVHGLTFSDITNALSTKLRETHKSDEDDGPGLWIDDVYEDYVVFWYGAKTWGQGYKMNGTTVELEGSKEEVKRSTHYARVTDGVIVGNEKTTTEEKKPMAKATKQTVDAIIANTGNTLGEDDREFLMGLDEERIAKFAVKPEPKQEPAPAPTANAGAPPAAAPAAPAPLTPEQWLAAAPPGHRDMFEDALRVNAQQRTSLISKITANKRNSFTAEELAGMRTPMLERLAAFATEDAAPAAGGNPFFMGFGAPAPAPTANAGAPAGEEEEGLTLAAWDFAASKN